MKTTDFITKRILHPSLSEEEQRWRVAATEGWVSTAVNLLLAGVKAVAGFASGSVALLADAVHSLSDVVTSLIIIVSYHIARQPSDEKHPFGHGRAEQTAGLIVAILLIVAGVELGRSAVVRIFHPGDIRVGVGLIALVVFTIVAKELLAQFSLRLARAIDSHALYADTWHHRTDAISSALVLLALLFTRLGLAWADGVVGLLVAGFIVLVGARLTREAISELMGHGPSEALVQEIKDIAMEHPEVLDAHDVIVHQYGRRKIISLHIGLDRNTSFDRSHDIAEQVEEDVSRRLGAHTTVHVDPLSDAEETRSVREALKEFVEQSDWAASFHDVHVQRNEDGSENLTVDVAVTSDFKTERAGEALKELEAFLRRKFPRLKEVRVQMEPPFAR